MGNSNHKSIFKHFLPDAELLRCEPYGGGHINGTYKILCKINSVERSYILQSINKNVFKNPDEVMHNIGLVAEFIAKKPNKSIGSLHFLKCDDGALYYKDSNGEYWRAYEYVDNSYAADKPSAEEFFEIGRAYGEFGQLLSSFPAEALYDTIPDFHNTPKRYDDLLKAINDDIAGRRHACKNEIEFIRQRKDFFPRLIDAHKNGLLPIRVCHNDTKCNNVLLDNRTGKGVCVIDLDTVMSGFSVTDFGDSIRSGAASAAEDEADLLRVKFDVEKFKLYTKGFLKGCGGMLLESEAALLPEGALMMLLESGIRFLTDYLNGDTYFKTKYPEHNLFRCRTQLKIAELLENELDTLKSIVISEYKSNNL